MRLICPNCNAQYEVPNDAVGTDGRDVQCSNCENTWFATPTPAPRSASDTLQKAAPVAQQTSQGKSYPKSHPAPPQRPLDRNVQEVLRQEAARELAARQRGTTESFGAQSDLALGDVDETTPPLPAKGDDDVAPSRNLLPDIEEINSSLAATPVTPRLQPGQTKPRAGLRKRKRRSFRSGFGLALLILTILTCAYIFAPELSEAIPQLNDPLNRYVLWMNDTRQMLFELSNDVIGALQQKGTTDPQ